MQGLLRRTARFVATVLVLVTVTFGVVRGARQLLVCGFTNEVLSKCCCTDEKNPSKMTEVRPTCCCLTMLVPALPTAAPAEAEWANLTPPPPLAVSVAPTLIASWGAELRTHVPPHQTGPPRLQRRLARLQVIHL
jgi:hypothetical protein